MFGLRRKGLPISVMLELEDSLNKSELHKYGAEKDDNYLAKEFNLEVAFVDDKWDMASKQSWHRQCIMASMV